MLYKFISEYSIIEQPKVLKTNKSVIINPTEEQLRAEGYTDLIEPDETPTYEFIVHYQLNDDGKIVKTYEERHPIVEDEPIKVWSKLQIILALNNIGKLDDFMTMLNANTLLKAVWEASNTIESNSLFSEYLPVIAEQLGVNSEDIDRLLDGCIV